MGAQPNHEALCKAGEKVGGLLASGEVDVALMVMSDSSVRAVGALANYIERAGVATALN